MKENKKNDDHRKKRQAMKELKKSKAHTNTLQGGLKLNSGLRNAKSGCCLPVPVKKVKEDPSEVHVSLKLSKVLSARADYDWKERCSKLCGHCFFRSFQNFCVKHIELVFQRINVMIENFIEFKKKIKILLKV